MAQQQPVLAADRLALGAVDNDDRPPPLGGDRRSFAAVGKPPPPLPRRPLASSWSISADRRLGSAP